MLSLESLAGLWDGRRAEAGARVREFSIGGRPLAFNSRPALMGVVNLSADSWYRESVCLSAQSAARRGRTLFAQGADMVDVGAESSLAHAARVDEAMQQSLLIPVVKILSGEAIPVSVETYAPAVARACLEAGASVVNLTGPVDSAEIYRMAAAHDAAVVVCYVQGGHVRAVGDFEFLADPIEGMREYFSRELDKAAAAGAGKIILDPGLGFYYRNLQDSATRVRHQMRIFLSTFRLRALGWPVCHALPHAFECFGEEVRCAEPFFGVLAALGKTDVFRTHEIPRMRAVLETLQLWEDATGAAEEKSPRIAE